MKADLQMKADKAVAYLNEKTQTVIRVTKRPDKAVAYLNEKTHTVLRVTKNTLSSRDVQVSLISAFLMAFWIGIGIGFLGLVLGGIAGLVCGVFLIPFTLGLSLPVCTTIGAIIGLCVGTFLGCVAGLLIGGALGHFVYPRRKELWHGAVNFATSAHAWLMGEADKARKTYARLTMGKCKIGEEKLDVKKMQALIAAAEAHVDKQLKDVRKEMQELRKHRTTNGEAVGSAEENAELEKMQTEVAAVGTDFSSQMTEMKNQLHEVTEVKKCGEEPELVVPATLGGTS